MPLKHYLRYDAFDIEANNLYYDVTKLWCSSHIDCFEEDSPAVNVRPENIEELGARLLEAKNNKVVVVGHNIVDYDLPAVEKILGISLDGIAFIDTLVLSRALEPDREGGHSLKMWGKRLGILKGTYGEDEGDTAWDKFSEEMMEYCEQDVRVTVGTLHALMEEAGVTEENIHLLVQIYVSPVVV